MWFAYQIPPTYRAQARFEIYRNRMLYINPSQQLREERKPSWNYDPTNYHIVRMQDLHDKVQSRLKSKWPQEITANVKIDSVENEGIIDKQYALEFLEELISLYKEKLKDESVNIHANTQLLLQKEKEDQEKKIVEMREKITDFELKNNLGFEKRKLESDQKHLVEIDARFRDIKAQRSILESQIKFLENANAATLRDALDLATHDPKAPNRQSNWADRI